MTNELSPMLKQFYNLKEKHPDALLLFSCGDFYETYKEDAEKVSEVLGITLTQSSKYLDNGKRIYMAGFPYHALDTYLPMLIRAGHRIAICDQLTDPTTKLPKRGADLPTTPQNSVTNSEIESRPNPNNPMDTAKTYISLCDQYAKASDAYYKQSSPIMSDQEFDNLQSKIRTLLEVNPSLITLGNPFSTPQDDHVEGFKKVQRTIPMLSFRDIYTRQEVETWWNSVGNTPISVEAKLDGLSLSLIYKNGKLVQASTRGKGLVGDDVTAQALNISNIPTTLDNNVNTEIRGEVTMPIATFKAWNDAHPNDKLANPRNAASGALKTLDPQAVIEKGLRFNAYTMPTKEAASVLETQQYAIANLDNLGFDTLPHKTYIATTLDEIMWAIENVQSQRTLYDMQIDGVVLKVNDLKMWNKLGNTDKFNKYGIAFKFKHEHVKSPLIAVDWQLAQDGSGRLSPVGIYENVDMLGTNCHRVTMNNIGWINRNFPNIHIGDYLLLTKGGDIIPRNDGFEPNPDHSTIELFDNVRSEKSEVGIVVRQTSGKVVEPIYCPKCGAILDKNGAHLYCPNKCIGTNKAPKAETSKSVPTSEIQSRTSLLSGLKFYITGTYSSPARRQELKRMVVENGGIDMKDFNNSCDYLVCGAKVGQAKVDKMIALGKEDHIIDEQQFLALLTK